MLRLAPLVLLVACVLDDPLGGGEEADLAIAGPAADCTVKTFERSEEGAIVESGTWWYDADGRPLHADRDMDADGVVERVDTWTYDAAGNETTYEEDLGPDAVADLRRTSTWDADGHELSRELDELADGTVNELQTWTFVGGLETESYWDHEALPPERTTYGYDAAGNRILHEHDGGADGTVDRRYTIVYDAAGNNIEETLDLGADGLFELTTWCTYDALGNPLACDMVSFVGEGGGSYTWTYDAAGLLLTLDLTSWDSDGVVQSADTWTYDADGNEIRYVMDWDADGQIEREIVSTWDAAGNPLTITVALWMPGLAEPDASTYTYSWDVDGNLLTMAYDNDGDGSTDEFHLYTYTPEPC